VRELNYQLKQLCRRNRDGSYRTQADRERQLTLIANQLHGLGYRKMNAQSLKPKHVEVLVKHWQQEDLSVGAIKNRLTSESGKEGKGSSPFTSVASARGSRGLISRLDSRGNSSRTSAGPTPGVNVSST
jgi:hypothetical protein